MRKAEEELEKERKDWENKEKNIQTNTVIEMIIKLYKKGLLSEENSATELNMSLEEYRECIRMYS